MPRFVVFFDPQTRRPLFAQPDSGAPAPTEIFCASLDGKRQASPSQLAIARLDEAPADFHALNCAAFRLSEDGRQLARPPAAAWPERPGCPWPAGAPRLVEAPTQVFRHDHFLPPQMAMEAFAMARDLPWQHGWKSDNGAESVHWHVDFDGDSGRKNANEEDISGRLTHPLVARVWEHMRERHFFGHTLVRCYANAHTFGTSGLYHMDRKEDGFYSAILYVSERWDAAWGGELSLRDDSGELFASFLPRPNRMISIPSNAMHAATGIERSCHQLRRCFVFKTRAPF